MKRQYPAKDYSAPIPLFEWVAPGETLPELKTDYTKVFDAINQKCHDWLETPSHSIKPRTFAYERILDESTNYPIPGHDKYETRNFQMRFLWIASDETGIIGAVIDGTQASSHSSFSDFCRESDVDNIFAIGVWNGFDAISEQFIRPEILANENYRQGAQLGRELARRYVY